jgi:hypothetical protein
MEQQYLALQSGRPTVDGVSRIASPLVEWLSGSGSPLIDPALSRDAIPFLRSLGVRFVLLTPSQFFDPLLAARVAEMLAQAEGVEQRGEFQETTAWEITQLPPPPAPEPGLTRVAADTMTLSASDLPDRVALAFDGDPNSRWYTSGAQSGNEWVAIDFAQPVDVAALVFTIHSRSLIDYPRVLEVVSQAGAGTPETVLYRGTILEPLGRGWRQSPERPVVELSLPVNQTTRLVLRQRGKAMPWRWAIDELALWERHRTR